MTESGERGHSRTQPPLRGLLIELMHCPGPIGERAARAMIDDTTGIDTLAYLEDFYLRLPREARDEAAEEMFRIVREEGLVRSRDVDRRLVELGLMEAQHNGTNLRKSTAAILRAAAEQLERGRPVEWPELPPEYQDLAIDQSLTGLLVVTDAPMGEQRAVIRHMTSEISAGEREFLLRGLSRIRPAFNRYHDRLTDSQRRDRGYNSVHRIMATLMGDVSDGSLMPPTLSQIMTKVPPSQHELVPPAMALLCARVLELDVRHDPQRAKRALGAISIFEARRLGNDVA